ncbi:MAG TPA: ParB/RepB/Spo0J family partition protein [Patescibacteria group bacterium]|nr:ParB/RepB/Spo0J family partition protein [Patescibacteria group bacterium]
MSAKGLGRGFDVLVPIGVDVAEVATGSHEKVHKLAVDIVVPKSDQPRRNFDETALNELAQSIREYGIVQPLIVSQIEQNLYSIIAGERRWRAAKIAGLTEVPAIIRSATEHQQIELALLENVQRTDLSPIELAATLYRLHHQFSQSYEDISKRLGKAYPTIINIIRLLGLPTEMQESLQAGNITEGHARSLLSLQKYPKEQKALFANILSKHWNVRQAEQFVVNVKRGQTADESKKPSKVVPDATATKIQKHLGAKKVILQTSAKGSGKLVITYSSEKELSKIVAKILK